MEELLLKQIEDLKKIIAIQDDTIKVMENHLKLKDRLMELAAKVQELTT